MSGLRIGNHNLPVWLIIISMVGIGSMTISSSSLIDPGSEGTTFQDEGAKATSKAFTGIPVHFDTTNPITLNVSGNGARAGAHVLTSQQLRINMLMQVADPATVTVPIRNESGDSSIIVVRVTADPSVLVDIDQGFSTSSVRLVGNNQWIMTVDDNANADFKINVAGLQPGAFFLLVEIFSV